MMQLYSTKPLYGATTAIFQIELANKECVYMSAIRTPYGNDRRCVVIVDADKFVQLWRNEPARVHDSISQGTIETWKNFRKLPSATEGFLCSIDNPVPLATVFYSKASSSPEISKPSFLESVKKLIGIPHPHKVTNFNEFIGFTNGITRIIWLLVHGVKYFPVECMIENGPEQLCELAGYQGLSYKTVEELTNENVDVALLWPDLHQANF